MVPATGILTTDIYADSCPVHCCNSSQLIMILQNLPEATK